MSIGNSIILFTAFSLLMETIISSKLSFLWAEITISLNVRQRRSNVVIFNVEFYNVGKRRNNVVKMTSSKKNKKTPGKIQIGKIQKEFLEFKILATIS